MNRKMRTLWIEALGGSGDAYWKLGILLLKGVGCKKDRKLAGLCLKKSAELGSARGYAAYYRLIGGERQVIDDLSYRDMYIDYMHSDSIREKQELGRYLSLGTRRQKQQYGLIRGHCKKLRGRGRQSLWRPLSGGRDGKGRRLQDRE